MASFGQTGTISNAQTRPYMVETSSITLSTADTIKFIQLYQQQELLWNVNLPDHTNKVKRTECLLDISRLMGYNWTEQQVKDKILSLRSRYSKEIVKVRVSIATGADHYAPVWRFFPLLDSFLRPFCTTRKTDTPVVRAFHKRLIEGMGQPTGSSPSKVPMSHPGGVAAASPHFCEVPLPANGYYSNYSQNALLPNNNYQEIDNYDDDDDLQIIEEDYSEGTVHSEPLCIDDDDDDNDDSNGNNNNMGREDGNVWNSQIQGNLGDTSENAENAGNFLGAEDSIGGGCNQSEQDRTLNAQPISENDPRISQLLQEDGVSLTALTAATSIPSRKEGNLPLAQEVVSSSGCSVSTQKETSSLVEHDTSSTLVGDGHGDTSQGGTKLGQKTYSSSGELHVKREKSFSPPCHPPPPPPLPPPVRQRTPLTDSPSWQLVEANSAEKALVYGHLNADEKIIDSYGLGQVTTCRASIVSGSGKTHTGEPAMKKIKQEVETTMQDVQVVQIDERASRVGFSRPNRSQSSTNHTKNVSTNQTNVGKMSKLNGADSAQASEELRKMALSSQTTNSSPDNSNCTASEVANIVSHVTNQITNAMTSQMTNLLQTLVPNLVEKSKPNVTGDSELAFVNHVVCELKKLDEDLQAEVKFSIQKALYEAQKDMRQRRSRHSESPPDPS